MLPVPDKSHARHLIWRKMCGGEDMKHWRFSASAFQNWRQGALIHSREENKSNFLTQWRLLFTQSIKVSMTRRVIFPQQSNCSSLHNSKVTHCVSTDFKNCFMREVPVVIMSSVSWCYWALPLKLDKTWTVEACEATLCHPEREYHYISFLSLVNNFDNWQRCQLKAITPNSFDKRKKWTRKNYYVFH